jgi:hypothetical protein
MDIKKHALYQLNRTDIFDSMHNTKATSQRFEMLNNEPSTTHIDFRTACAVEMLDNALKHGFDKLFEVGIPIFQVSMAIRYLVNRDYAVTKDEQQKLLDSCDAFSNWVRDNYKVGIGMNRLVHDTFHRLSELYRTIKELQTSDESHDREEQT